ncbi:MAG: hypothetical protein AAF799_16460 [Myxococcota bacterium]
MEDKRYAISSITEQEFKDRTVPKSELEDPERFTKSDAEERAKTERLLDLKPGALADDDHYLAKYTCPCGRTLTFYDFVLTGIVDAGHAKSFIAEVFLGDEYVIQQPRKVRCSNCSRVTPRGFGYGCPQYGCSTHPTSTA